MVQFGPLKSGLEGLSRSESTGQNYKNPHRHLRQEQQLMLDAGEIFKKNKLVYLFVDHNLLSPL